MNENPNFSRYPLENSSILNKMPILGQPPREKKEKMRPLSMTGFGTGEQNRDGHIWSVDVRTVNHRFLDIRVKIPHSYLGLEEKIRQRVSALHSRGRVEVSIELRGNVAGESTMSVNMNLAQQYFDCLQEINHKLDLNQTPLLSEIISQRDVISRQEKTPDLESEWQALQTALDGALSTCQHMREKEGESLQRDLLGRLHFFSSTIEEIETQLPEILSQRRETLQKRLANLQDSIEIDPARLAQEMALLVDKSDVTEELVRLHSHIHQFETFLHMDEPVGRRLDFLLQEFLREVNTMASKITNSSVAHTTVTLKSEIEKMREQVQNIE